MNILSSDCFALANSLISSLKSVILNNYIKKLNINKKSINNFLK